MSDAGEDPGSFLKDDTWHFRTESLGGNVCYVSVAVTFDRDDRNGRVTVFVNGEKTDHSI